MTLTNSVEILKSDGTVTTFARATVDRFTADALIVLSIDDGAVLEFYGPGTWREGSAFGADGHPLHSFTAEVPA